MPLAVAICTFVATYLGERIGLMGRRAGALQSARTRAVGGAVPEARPSRTGASALIIWA